MTGFVQAMILLTVFCPGLAGVLAAEDASPFESAQSSPLSPAGTQTSPLRTTPLTSVLPAEQAFRLNVVVELPDTIVAIWEITDGYYLYRKSLQLEEAGSAGLLGEIRIPAGTLINDQFFGDVEVFHDRVTVSVPLASPTVENIELLVQFQGCAEAGYCYPLQFRQVNLEIPR